MVCSHTVLRLQYVVCHAYMKRIARQKSPPILSPVHTVAEKWDCLTKVKLSQKSATVAEFGDSLTFLRLCGQGFTCIVAYPWIEVIDAGGVDSRRFFDPVHRNGLFDVSQWPLTRKPDLSCQVLVNGDVQLISRRVAPHDTCNWLEVSLRGSGNTTKLVNW